jgi:geranylgeranyl pyrophosphate synthase
VTTRLAVARPAAEAFLAHVDAHMLELVGSRDGVARTAARHSLVAGGKRLRPLMVCAGTPVAALPVLHDADVGDAHVPAAVRAASAIELVHTASLVHDDVLDDAEVRRGVATVGHLHGVAAATAVGDLLFSQAFTTLVATRSEVGDAVALDAVATLAHTAQTLAAGEALQASQCRRTDLHDDAYLTRCERKTGVLFGAALHLGALLGGASAHDIRLLARYGTQVGLAFQLADDVLDCQPPDAEATLGKRPGVDVRDGTMTLPLLLAARSDDTLAVMLRDPSPDVDAVLARVAATNALEAATDRARAIASEALALLESLQGTYDMTLLTAIADRAVRRLS